MNDFNVTKQEIIKKLLEKGIKGVCPMCGNNHFGVADSFFNSPLQKNLNTFNLGGPSIPAVPMICTNCGFISQHALGTLGLLPPEEKKDEK